MKKSILFNLMLLLISWSINAQTATPPSLGDGTSGNPYEIATLDNLYWITTNPSTWDKHFIQTADIDASATITWNSGAGFSPIGNSTTIFIGSYNGNGYTISNFYINRPSAIQQGMFGITGVRVDDINTGAVFKKIGLVNVNIKGKSLTGGLVGNPQYSTSISECFVTGKVSGDQFVGGLVGYPAEFVVINKCYVTCDVSGSTHVGGLVGVLQWDCTIENSYATGKVIGTSKVGGLVGNNVFSAISNAYATGSVTGGSEPGGLVGRNDGGTVTNSFWDIETSGQTTSAGGTGKTTTEMKTKSTFTDAGWSFDPVWGIIEPTYCGLSYPYLVNNRQNPEPGMVLYNPLIEAITPSGDGSAGNPYQIATLENLYWIAVNSSSWDKYFIQTADIDASATAEWCTGGWFPIGFDYDNAFSGNYDGKGHSISGLYITNSSAEYYGLFGHAKNAAFQNLGITDVYLNLEGVTNSSGALLGYAESSVSVNNCFSTGVVKGNNNTGGLGGLVGCIYKYSILENSYSTCDVSGSVDIGGLVGSSYYFCSIINCFHTTGIVSSTSYASGGLVGVNSQSLISKCYSTGSVMGKYHIGGLVGWNDNASISDCFSRCTILNTSSIIDNFGGLVGVNTYNSTINNCYSTGSVQVGMGGLVGVQDEGATTTNSFWDTQTSGTTWSADGAGEGKYTSEMITLSTFTDAGWDFTTIWGINSSYNEGYPYLVPATLTLISGSNIQTACADIEITPIVYTVDGFVAGVSLSPESPSGLSGIYDKDAKTFTISGTITDAGVYIFNVTTTGTLTPDIQATTTGSITVNESLTPSVTITSTDTDNIICVNTGVTFNAIPHNTGDGTVAYQWYYYNKLQNTLYDYDTWNGNTWYSNELEDGDEIYCEITVTGGNCFTSLTATSEKITMEVYDSETRPTVKIESDAPEELCPGTNVTFTALAENTEGGIVSYQWYYFYKKTNTIYHYDSWNEQTWWSDELEDDDEVYCEITVTDAACFSSAVASSNKITISEIPYPDAGVITGKNVIQVGESVQFSSDCEIEGFWACLDENVDDDIEIASVDEDGMVTGNFVGTATIYYVIQVEKNPPCYFDSGWTGFPITVTAAPEINTQTFTSSGQFVVPDGVYSLNIKAWGGGGGGSYRYRIDDTDPYGPGAGGGGGGFCGGTFNVTPGDLISVTVGTGGSGGYDGTGNGDDGETSVIEYDDIIIEAYGGYGGKSGLDGGTAGDGNDGWYTGDIINPVKYMGGNGAAGFISDGQGTGGAGGGGAGDQAQGGDASGNTGGFGGNNGGGQGGSSGETGLTYGGGGGGVNGNDNSSGGDGASGAVIIEWMESTCKPPAPTFTESPTSPQCAGVDVTYTTQADKTSYVWNIPGTEDTDYEIISGGTSSDNSVTLKWLTAGSKTITVNYTEDCQGVTPASSTITVNPNPSLTGVTPSAWGVCIGGSVVFTASGLLDGPTDFVYTLTYDDNVDGTENIVTTVETDPIEVSGGVATFTIDAPALGSYFFEIKSATINGCTTNFSNVDNYDYFVAYPQPSVILISTDILTSICSGTETVLTAYITSAGVGMNHISIQKLVSGDWVEILGSDDYDNISVSPTETTTYRAIYSTQGNGCNEAISENLTITVKPQPTLTDFTIDKETVCEDYESEDARPTITFSGLLNADNRINATLIENGNTDEARTGDIEISQLDLFENEGSWYYKIKPDYAIGSFQVILNSISANGCTTTFDENNKPSVSWVIHPLPTVNISGDLVACGKTTLTAETGATGVTYTWGRYIPEYDVIAEATGSTLEVTETGTYSVYVTNIETNCEKLVKVDVTINPVPVVAITGNTSIFIGGTTSLSPNTGGTWTSSNEGVATVTDAGVVTGIAEGTATFAFTNTSNGCSATTESITVTGTPPSFTACPSNQSANTAAGLCSAVVTYTAAAGGTPEPIVTYKFTGATTGSGSGTGSGSVFNTGETLVAITASNGIAPDATCSFKVIVTDNEAPAITCAQEITQTADPGMCSAELTIASPAATDNCDPDVIVVNSFNNNLVQNGDFNSGTANWQDCGNTAEVNTEEYYIVPLPPVSTNRVAEIDVDMSLCQTISGFTIGKEYILTFKATRRQNDDTPNPVSAVVTIDGGALSKVVTRTNTIFNLTPVAFKFTATKTTHQLKFTPHTDNDYVLGFIVDDIAVTQVNNPTITYPVGVTQVVWTAIDIYGNASSCTQNVTVTDNELPVITAEADITKNTDAGLCSAVVTIVDATAEDNCEVGAVTGTRDDGKELANPYPVGTTTITWEVSDVNGNPATPVTQLVTVTDKQAPQITCAEEIIQTADAGMCSAVVTVVPPVVTDNCDNNVLPVSNTELIKNGNFNDGVSNWQDCVNKAEVNTEEYYIVPLPPKSSNYVAEVDKEVSLCQIISGFTVGDKYVLTFKATRRQNTSTPNPVSANVIIDGGALSEVVTRTNTTFELTPESFVFTATQETHQLTFTPYTDNTYVLGFIVDDVSVRSITYPVGTTTLVWNVTDVYGNTSTCKQNITVTDNEAPVITDNADIEQNADPGLCSAVVVVSAPMATDNCSIQGSVAGTRSDAPLTLADPFPVGTTTITWTVSDVNGNPATPVTQLVTLTDKQAPQITCAEEIIQTADAGMCSAVVTVVPPVVTDNCDNNVLPVSNTELIKNGNFNDGVSNWQDCVNKAEVNTEEYYIVPLPPKSSNYVAEVDKEVSLCQIISGFTVGDKYVLTFKATRRQNTSTPNPVSANVIIDGGALSEVVTRTNTTFELTPESFVFTATQETHQLTFTPYTDNTYVLGFIVDDVSVRSITYPVGTTTLVWTTTDVYGNTSTCKQNITVTDNEAPVITDNADIEQNADPGLCSAVVVVSAPMATDNCSIQGSVAGTRSDAPLTLDDPFPVGTTTITWEVSDVNGNPATPVTQLVTVTDKQAPQITCAEEIIQTADAGMCSAVVTVVPPVVTDNCDNNVLPVSNTELIKNGNFNEGVSNWQYCGNKAEVNTEEYYIVPLPPKSSNYVAEVDKEVSLCQIISGFTVGDKYVLTFKATRRQNTSTPNPVSANVIIDGGALSEVVTRTNTTFELTPESFVFTATQETHQLTFTPYTDNTYVLGFIVDDVSVRSITYPVGTTTLVWNVTDVYGNTNTCKQKITVNDEEAPTAICKDIEVTLGQDGTVLIEENAVNNGSSDNCTSDSNVIELVTLRCNCCNFLP
jgi:hypothetical protein